MKEGNSVTLTPIVATWRLGTTAADKEDFALLRYEAPSGEGVIIAEVWARRQVVLDVHGRKVLDVERVPRSTEDGMAWCESALRQRGIIS